VQRVQGGQIRGLELAQRRPQSTRLGGMSPVPGRGRPRRKSRPIGRQFGVSCRDNCAKSSQLTTSFRCGRGRYHAEQAGLIASRRHSRPRQLLCRLAGKRTFRRQVLLAIALRLPVSAANRQPWRWLARQISSSRRAAARRPAGRQSRAPSRPRCHADTLDQVVGRDHRQAGKNREKNHGKENCFGKEPACPRKNFTSRWERTRTPFSAKSPKSFPDRMLLQGRRPNISVWHIVCMLLTRQTREYQPRQLDARSVPGSS